MKTTIKILILFVKYKLKGFYSVKNIEYLEKNVDSNKVQKPDILDV